MWPGVGEIVGDGQTGDVLSSRDESGAGIGRGDGDGGHAACAPVMMTGKCILQ